MDCPALSFDQNSLERQYEINRIVFLSKFSEKTVCFKSDCLSIKISLKTIG